MHEVTGVSPRLIRIAIYLLACLATITLMMSYRGLFNPDTLIHSVLMPTIMADEGKLLLDNFTYSNNDHRTLFISVFHFPMALLSTDNPWLIYLSGSIIMSALYLFVWAKLSERLGLPIFMTSIVVFYFAITPGYLYFEHTHAQNSYILNAVFLLVGLGAMHNVYSKKTFADRKPVIGFKQIMQNGEPTTLSSPDYKWVFAALFIAVCLETVANLSRAVITLIAPFLIAIVSVNIIRWQLPSKKVLISIAVIISATVLGLMVYLYLTSTLTYTMGAARSPSLDNFKGQGQAFKDVGLGLLALTQWYMPVVDGPPHLRSISATLIVIYLAYNWCKALWLRTDEFGVFLLVLVSVSFTLFAIAINLADIKMAPRYTIPLMLIILFSLLYFYTRESGWKKHIAPVAFAGLLLDAIFFSTFYVNVGNDFKYQQLALYDYLEERQVELGLTSRDFASTLSLQYGVGNFIPVGFDVDGNYRELPFHTLRYYTPTGNLNNTAYVYTEKDKLKKANNDRLAQLLSAHNLKVISDELVPGVASRPVNVMLIEGDARKIFMGKNIGVTSQIIFNENSRFKGAEVDDIAECGTSLNLAANDADFSFRSNEYLVEAGRYLLTVENNFPPDRFFSDLVIVVQFLDTGAGLRRVYTKQGLEFDVNETSRVAFILLDKKPASGAICGLSVTRIE